MLSHFRSFVALLFVTVSVSALAGGTQPAPVIVDLDDGFAGGDMITARYSKDEEEFIGCGTRTIGGGFSWGFCQAEDAEGDRAICFTEDPALVAAIDAISDFSYITYRWFDPAGDGNLECTFVGHSTQSFYLPEKLKANK